MREKRDDMEKTVNIVKVLRRRQLKLLSPTLSEAVLELSGDSLEVTHAASAGGSPSLSLLAPLV